MPDPWLVASHTRMDMNQVSQTGDESICRSVYQLFRHPVEIPGLRYLLPCYVFYAVALSVVVSPYDSMRRVPRKARWLLVVVVSKRV